MINYKDYIEEVPDFPKEGISFKDISALLQCNDVFSEAIRDLFWLTDYGFNSSPDYWVGIESRGFIFAAALSKAFGGGLLLCRKAGKLPPPVVDFTYELEYGSDKLEMKSGEGTVVIVDDVYATGGTMMAAECLCKKAGYHITDKIVFADLLYVHGQDKIVKSVIQYE